MPGKFVEINPSISLRANSIQAGAVNTDRSSWFNCHLNRV